MLVFADQGMLQQLSPTNEFTVASQRTSLHFAVFPAELSCTQQLEYRLSGFSK
jgi:hypothetical protein